MSTAAAFGLLFIAAVGLGARAPCLLRRLGGVAARAVLLLFPPAVRNALSLLNCAPATVSPAGCASLNGCKHSGGGGGRGIVSVSVLSSNPFYVCWATDGAHNTAGAIAVISLAVVVIGFTLASLWAVFRQQQDMFAPQKRGGVFRCSVEVESDRSNVPVVINPLRQGAAAVQVIPPPEPARLALDTSPLLTAFLSDYRPGAWYTRHADLALSLLLAILQVMHAMSWGVRPCLE